MSLVQAERIECPECRGVGGIPVPSYQGGATHTECDACDTDGAGPGFVWPECDGLTDKPHPVYPRMMLRCGDAVDGETCAECIAIDSRYLCAVCLANPAQHVCDVNPEMMGKQ